MTQEAALPVNKDILLSVCELHSKETLVSDEIISGSMVAHQYSGRPANPEEAAAIQKIVIDTMYMVLDDFGILLSNTMKA